MNKFVNPQEYTVDNLFKGKYVIPVFQRPYSWGSEQVRELLNDIFEAFSNYQNKTSSDNDDLMLFAGTIMLKSVENVRNVYTEYQVIDGQQRTTTLTLMFMVILNYLQQNSSQDRMVWEIKDYLWKNIDRNNDKNLRVLTLGNVDKEILVNLFDELYGKKDIIVFANNKLEVANNAVVRNLLKNLVLIDSILKKFKREEEYLDFVAFLKNNIRFIAIIIETKLTKLFSIFEAVNGKGKQLEDIDLIKSYIFQNLDESDYNTYLNKWGLLIKETNDNLMDYLTVYIRANVAYYRNSIKLNNFKSLMSTELAKFYKTTDAKQVLKTLIDDLEKNVRYYNLLFNADIAKPGELSHQNIAYLMLNNAMDYTHTKALFFKLMTLKKYNKLSNETVDAMIELAFKFIMTAQSISSRESKFTLSVFASIQEKIYTLTQSYDDNIDLSKEKLDFIPTIIYKVIYDETINVQSLKNAIKMNVTFSRNKKASKALLSYILYTDNNGNTDYLKLQQLLKIWGAFHIDHILPQNPKPDDHNFKYYVSGNSMVLKPENDFVNDPMITYVNLDEFYDTYLHVIGNLRLEWANDNIRKSNKLISLSVFNEVFNTNTQIMQRTTEVVNKIINSGVLLAVENIPAAYSSVKTAKAKSYETLSQYDSGFSYEEYNPISLNYCGQETPLSQHKWKVLLKKFMDVAYYMSPEGFDELADKNFSPTQSNRVYISKDKTKIRNSFDLGGKIYVETNLSGQYIVKFIFAVLEELNLQDGNLKITVMKKQ